MTEYIIIVEDTAARLQAKVANALNDGWQCQGGISMSVKYILSNCSCEQYYAQAMVRTSEEE